MATEKSICNIVTSFLPDFMLQRHKKWLPLLIAIIFWGCGASEDQNKNSGANNQATSQKESTDGKENSETSDEEIVAIDAASFFSANELGKLDDETRADPAKVYSILCSRCHGLNGEPVFPGAPNLKELTCPKRAITGTIYSGRGPMPSFANVLTRPEISRLADYVQKMQQPQ